MAEAITDPLRGPEPTEVPLPHAPLVRVLSQVRFSEVLSITKKDFIASFHEAIRHDYPILNSEQRRAVQVGPNTNQVMSEQIWRFFDATNNWRVSLATNFVSLETRSYESRADFISRWLKVLDGVQHEINPAFATRVGVRYVDQVEEPELNHISKLIRPEMVGIANLVVVPDLNHVVTEANCEIAEGKLFARWGRLPANSTHDPDVMEPVGSPSWFFDLDASRSFDQNEQEFETEALESLATLLAIRAYTVFRWAVTDEFLKMYGAEV